ncbi:MAG: type I secretion system permease/ATPase, partial [Jannaschia sp.]
MQTDPDAYTTAWKRMRGTLFAAAVFSAAVNLLMLTGPMFMLQVYDRVLASGSVATLQGLFALVVALYTFMGLYDFLRVRLLSRAAHRLDAAVGDPAFRLWVGTGMAGQGGARARPLHDLAVVRGFLSSPTMPALFDLPWVPFYLAICFFVHPWIGFLTLAGAAVVFVAALANQWLTRLSLGQAMAMDANESFFVEQARRNAEAVLPQGMLTPIANRWRAMHDAGLATGQTGAERGEGFTAFSKSFRLLLQSSLLGLGAYLVLQQEMSPGMIIAASIIAGRALAPIDQVIGQWRGVVRARSAHRSLRDLFASAPVDRQKTELPAPKGHLTVEDITVFAPNAPGPERKPILEGVSFALEPGDALGVIGPSASGKSTLARVLVGSWTAQAGAVRIDGARLDQWNAVQLGRALGYLPQSLELMAGTVRDNIARFDPEATDQQVVEAAQLAGVHEMILKLPQGYDTSLEPGQSGPLSGGQVQRIGLARALFGTPALVVLDEPNSNLDAGGDEALAAAVGALRARGATVVVMAHRPSAIAAVNKVLVVQDGRVAHFGDKAEVI